MPGEGKEVKWGEDNELDVVPTLSEEEQQALKDRMAAMDALLAEQKVGKYKIELLFGHKRSGRAPYAGALSLWESGSKFHGGGDTKVYECPGKALGKSDCMGFIPDAANGYGFLVCPSCGVTWKGDQVNGERIAKLTTQNWAQLILNYFVRLEMNADIYIKAPKMDLRVAAKQEQQKQLMGEKLHAARTKRDVFIYPLKNIIKDTTNGADLYGRFVAFLKS